MEANAIDLVPLEWLKPHEQTKESNLQQLLKMTLRWGAYTKPLLVDRCTGAILDGHHRHQIGIKLGLERLPAIVCNYLDDDNIVVDAYPNSSKSSLSKTEVIQMALSDDLFPPKTSRHTLTEDMPPIQINLDVLR